MNNKEIAAQIAKQFYEVAERETRGIRAQFEYTKSQEEEFRNIPIETLITDPYFLGLRDHIYPSHLEDIKSLWEERSKRPINLALFEESIGCVTGDSIIYTKDGPIKFRDVLNTQLISSHVWEINLRVLTSLGMNKATYFKKTGYEKTIRIFTEWGYEIEGTLDHPLLIKDKETGEITEKTLKELKIGDLVGISFQEKPFGSQEELTSEEAYYLGRVYANYNYSEIPDFLLYQNKKILSNLLGGIFDALLEINGGLTINSKYRKFLRDVQELLGLFGIISFITPLEKSWSLTIAYEQSQEFIKKIKVRDFFKEEDYEEIKFKTFSYGTYSKIAWVPVIVKKESEGVCYDLTIPETGEFIVNNIWSKNSGKTLLASVIIWLQWYEVATIVDPQTYYGLTPGSTIAFMALSRTQAQTQRVIFSEIFKRFQSGFNKDYFPPSPRYSKEIQIEQNNTVIYGGTSSELSLLGYNLYSAVIDEANFLEVIEGSKRSDSEVYDAAEAMYNATYNRMVSRFMRAGKVPGFIVMISSRKSRNSFMERKIREAILRHNDPNNGIFYRVKPLWKAKPPEYFPSKKFFYIDTERLTRVPENFGRELYKLQAKLVRRRTELKGPDTSYLGLI